MPQFLPANNLHIPLRQHPPNPTIIPTTPQNIAPPPSLPMRPQINKWQYHNRIKSLFFLFFNIFINILFNYFLYFIYTFFILCLLFYAWLLLLFDYCLWAFIWGFGDLLCGLFGQDCLFLLFCQLVFAFVCVFRTGCHMQHVLLCDL